jgi:hypothetical protein
VLATIKEQINRNVKLWEDIHDVTRTNDLKQLMTLLSNRTVNLNSFNLSTDGDTILHSALKSNDARMMSFIMGNLSRGTRERMLKMKNAQGQLPVDLVRVYAINTFTVSSEIQTSCESSVDVWSKEARWNSLSPSNSLLQTTQRSSL